MDPQTLRRFRTESSQKSPSWGKDVRAAAKDTSNDDLREIFEDSTRGAGERFVAFYPYQVRLRGERNYEEFKKNVEEYTHLFEKMPLFTFMRAEAYGDASGDSHAREIAIEFAREAAERLPDTPGVQHLLAEYLLESIEIGTVVADDRGQLDRLLEAEKAVSRAIAIDSSYAKYHATKGRVLAQLDDFGGALSAIDRAINLEDATTSRGEFRVQNYQLYRREVIQGRRAKSVMERQTEAVEEFRSLRGELLSLLGLLAAVIALISTSASIGSALKSVDGLAVEVGTAGAILVVFSGFHLLFAQEVRLKRIMIATAFGGVLIGAAIAIRCFLGS